MPKLWEWRPLDGLFRPFRRNIFRLKEYFEPGLSDSESTLYLLFLCGIFCNFLCFWLLFIFSRNGWRTHTYARTKATGCVSVSASSGWERVCVCVCLYFYGCQRQAPSVRGRGNQQAGRGRCPAVRYRRTSLLFVCLPAGITDRRSIQASKTTRRSSSPRRFALNQLFQQRHTELSRLTSTGSY